MLFQLLVMVAGWLAFDSTWRLHRLDQPIGPGSLKPGSWVSSLPSGRLLGAGKAPKEKVAADAARLVYRGMLTRYLVPLTLADDN